MFMDQDYLQSKIQTLQYLIVTISNKAWPCMDKEHHPVHTSDTLKPCKSKLIFYNKLVNSSYIYMTLMFFPIFSEFENYMLEPVYLGNIIRGIWEAFCFCSSTEMKKILPKPSSSLQCKLSSFIFARNSTTKLSQYSSKYDF